MKKYINTFKKSIIAWITFSLTVFWMVYAVDFISSVKTQQIPSWSIMWEWWYQDVNDKLLEYDQNAGGADSLSNPTFFETPAYWATNLWYHEFYNRDCNLYCTEVEWYNFWFMSKSVWYANGMHNICACF